VDRAQALRVFQAHNRARVSRLTELAPHKQALFFRLLPLLFHINHKLLPGYVSDDCPAGIMDYQPDNEALNSAISLNRNFSHRRRALRRYALRGLYLLNPTGQIRYPEPASFDLWLVHHATLKPEHLTILQSKAESIVQWAASLGIYLRYRLLDETQCRTDALSGSEREQFYLQGLCIAGSAPLWWLITTEEQLSYPQVAERLLSQRGLTQISLMDFGFDQSSKAEDLFNEACQALKKSIQGDITALLDLVFVQHQLALFPNIIHLSERYKQKVEQGETDSMLVEPASLKLAAIEQFAATNDQHRARQSYYALCSERLSQQVKHPQFAWRRHSLLRLQTDWNWSAETLKNEDSRTGWSYPQRHQWWLDLSRTLENVFSALQLFASQHSVSNVTELNELQQLMSLAANNHDSVIEQLPMALQTTEGPDQLFLYRFSEQTEWKLSTIPLNDAKQVGLKQHSSLVCLLVWAVRNHILTTRSWLKVADQKHQISINLVLELTQTLLKSALPSFQQEISSELLLQPAKAEKLMLFANLQPPGGDFQQAGAVQMASLNNDPLSYTSSRQNLVHSLDLVIYSSWGQWHHYRFDSQNAVVETLRQVLSWPPATQLSSHISVWCATGFFGQAINMRLQRLFEAVLTHYQYYPQQGRYLLMLGDRLSQLQWHDGHMLIKQFAAEKKLSQALAEEQKQYLPSRVDSYLDSDNLLNSLLQYQKQQTVSLFAYRQTENTEVYVVDELGRIQQFTYPALTESQLLAQLKLFILNSLGDSTMHCECYQLLRQQQRWQINAIKPNRPDSASFSVIWQITGAQLALGLNSHTVKTDLGDPQLSQILAELFQQHQGRKPAFYFIDKLQFVPKAAYSSLFFLNRKYELEQQFNTVTL
jgi:adenylate cyclase class 1|tara:strand:+ start:1892 stop:4525 length:2634 start_codon:yes stop_codon:yes gene_type:complete